jgi:hypothetical protein
MKHFYLLCGIILLTNGVMAKETPPLTSRAEIVHVSPNRDFSHAAEHFLIAVNGRVTDENGAPFPNVNKIIVKMSFITQYPD